MAGNGNDPSPMPGWLLPLGAVVLLLILLCCSSLAMSYSRTGNINIFSSSKEFSAEELAYAQAHGGAMPPGSSTGASGLGLLDAFGVKQKCKVGPWSEWSACDANCGTTAHRTRTRSVVTPAKNGGACMDPLTESDLCTSLPSCEVPAINGQYEPCTDGGQLEGAMCRVHGIDISASECNDLKNQAALTGFTSTGSWIGAAVGASEIDCGSLYKCQSGYNDTHVGHMCDKEATPKCPPGGYTWDWTRRMCIMPSTGSLAPAPSPSA